ncbi:MAG: hypothetical protein V5A48_08155 [Salinivenus sp.]
MDSAQARPPVIPPSLSSAQSETTLVLINAQSRAEVEQHPEIESRLSDGWTIRRAVPRIVEKGGAKWLLVLERPTGDAPTPALREDARNRTTSRPARP